MRWYVKSLIGLWQRLAICHLGEEPKMSMDASKWLWSIIPKTKKRSGRESLEGVHHHSDCVFSTDSYRVHIWHLSNTGPCEVCTKKDTITLAPIFRQVAESQTRFTVSTKHLKKIG